MELAGQIDTLRRSMWSFDERARDLSLLLEDFGNQALAHEAHLASPDEATQADIATRKLPPAQILGQRVAYGRLACAAIFARAQNDRTLPASDKLALLGQVRTLAQRQHAMDARRSTRDAYWFGWSLFESAHATEASQGPTAALELIDSELPQLREMYRDRVRQALGLDPDFVPGEAAAPINPYDRADGPQRWDFAALRFRSTLLLSLGRVEDALRCCDDTLEALGAEYRWQLTTDRHRNQAPRLLASMAWVNKDRARAFGRMGLLDRAAEATQSMQLVVDELQAASAELAKDHVRDINSALLRTGELLLELGLNREVRTFAKNAIESDSGALPFRNRIRYLLARAERHSIEASGIEPTEAEWSHIAQLLSTATESDSGTPLFRQAASIEHAKFELARGRPEAASDRIDWARDVGPTELAPGTKLEIIRLRARIALELDEDLPSLRMIHMDLLEATNAEISSWELAPLRPGGVGFLSDRDIRSSLGTLIQLELRLNPEGGPERALEHLIRAQTGSSLARFLGARTWNLGELQPSPGHGYVVLLPAPRTSWLFTFDAQGVHAQELDSEPVLCAAALAHARETVGAIEGSWSQGKERALAQQLTDLCFPPAAAQRIASWDAVTLVGFDLLGRNAAEFLPGPWGDYLCTSKALDFLPSLPMHAALRARRESHSTPESALLLMADPSQDPASEEVQGKPPLNITARELDEIGSAYSTPRVQELKGSNASRAAFLESEPGLFAVIQFLVHGVHQAEKERSATLLLAGDMGGSALLTCDDIDGGNTGSALDLAGTRLVMVTACRAGDGPDRGGDACSSDLGGAFLRAGADVVATSRSDLELGRTLRLSELFHRNLAQGETPAEALRAARAALSAEGTSPLETGWLRLFGLGHVPVFEEAATQPGDSAMRSGRALGLGSLLGAALLGAWWLLRKRNHLAA